MTWAGQPRKLPMSGLVMCDDADFYAPLVERRRSSTPRARGVGDGTSGAQTCPRDMLRGDYGRTVGPWRHWFRGKVGWAGNDLGDGVKTGAEAN